MKVTDNIKDTSLLPNVYHQSVIFLVRAHVILELEPFVLWDKKCNILKAKIKRGGKLYYTFQFNQSSVLNAIDDTQGLYLKALHNQNVRISK